MCIQIKSNMLKMKRIIKGQKWTRQKDDITKKKLIDKQEIEGNNKSEGRRQKMKIIIFKSNKLVRRSIFK